MVFLSRNSGENPWKPHKFIGCEIFQWIAQFICLSFFRGFPTILDITPSTIMASKYFFNHLVQPNQKLGPYKKFIQLFKYHLAYKSWFPCLVRMSTIILVEPLHQLVVHKLFFSRGGRGLAFLDSKCRLDICGRRRPSARFPSASSSSRRSGLLAASTSMVSRPPKVASVPSYWVAEVALPQFRWVPFWKEIGVWFLLRSWELTCPLTCTSQREQRFVKSGEKKMGKTTTPSTAYSWPTAASWGVVPGESNMADCKIHQFQDFQPKKIQAIQPGTFN